MSQSPRPLEVTCINAMSGSSLELIYVNSRVVCLKPDESFYMSSPDDANRDFGT